MLTRLIQGHTANRGQGKNGHLSCKAHVFLSPCHLCHQGQWDTMMEHMLVKPHHGSVLVVCTPEHRKAICPKDNLHSLHFPGG